MRDDELDGGRILERLRLKNLAGKKNLIEDLKNRKSQRSVSLLVEMLQDESWYLREQAVKALTDAGDEARGPVLELLRNGLWFARASAARVLGKIGDGGDADSLIDCLMDSNMTVQGAAASALIDIARSASVADIASPLAARSQDVKDKAISCIRLLDADVADGILSSWDRSITGKSDSGAASKEHGDE